MQSKINGAILVNTLKYDFNNNSEQACFYIEPSQHVESAKLKEKFLWHSQKWNLALIDENKLTPINHKNRYKNFQQSTTRTFLRRPKLPNDGDNFTVSLVKSKHNDGVLHDVVWSAENISTQEKYLHVICYETDINITNIIADRPKVVYEPSHQHEDFEKSYQSHFENSTSHADEKEGGEIAKICYTTEKLLRLQTYKEFYEITPVNIKLSYDPVVIFATEYEKIFGFSTSRFQISERGSKMCDSQKLQVTTRGGRLSDFSLSFSEMGKLKNLFRKNKEVDDIVYEYIPDDMLVIDCIDENPVKHKAVIADDAVIEGYQEMNLNTTMQSVSIRLKSNLNKSYDSLDLPILSKRKSFSNDCTQDISAETSKTSTSSEFQKVYSEIEKLNSKTENFDPLLITKETDAELEVFCQSIHMERQNSNYERIFNELLEENKLFKRPKLPGNLRPSQNLNVPHETQNLVTVNVQKRTNSSQARKVSNNCFENVLEDEITELFLPVSFTEINFEDMEQNLIQEEIDCELSSIKLSINKADKHIENINDEIVLQKQQICTLKKRNVDRKQRTELKSFIPVAIKYKGKNNNQPKLPPYKLPDLQNHIIEDIIYESICHDSSLDTDLQIFEEEELKSFIHEININCRPATMQIPSEDVFEMMSSSDFLPVKINSKSYLTECVINQTQPLILQQYLENKNNKIGLENYKLREKDIIIEYNVDMQINYENFLKPDFENLLLDDFNEDLNIEKWEGLEIISSEPNIKKYGSLCEEVVLQKNNLSKKIDSKNENNNSGYKNKTCSRTDVSLIKPIISCNHVQNENANNNFQKQPLSYKEPILDDTITKFLYDESRVEIDFEMLEDIELRSFLNETILKKSPAVSRTADSFNEVVLTKDPSIKTKTTSNNKNSNIHLNRLLKNQAQVLTLIKDDMFSTIEPKERSNDKLEIFESNVGFEIKDDNFNKSDFEVLILDDFKEDLSIETWETINNTEKNTHLSVFLSADITVDILAKNGENFNQASRSTKLDRNKFNLYSKKITPFILEPCNENNLNGENYYEKRSEHARSRCTINEETVNITLSSQIIKEPNFEKLILDDIEINYNINAWKSVEHVNKDLLRVYSSTLLEEEVMLKNTEIKRTKSTSLDQGEVLVKITPIKFNDVILLSDSAYQRSINSTHGVKDYINEEEVFETTNENPIHVNLNKMDYSSTDENEIFKKQRLLDCEDGIKKPPPSVKKKSLKAKAKNLLSKKFKLKENDANEKKLRKHSLDTNLELSKVNMKRSCSMDSFMHSDIDPNRVNCKTNFSYDQVRYNKSNSIIKSRLYTPEVVRKKLENEINLIKKERQKVPNNMKKSPSVILERKNVSFGHVTLTSVIPEKNKYSGSLSVGKLTIPESFSVSSNTEKNKKK